MGQKLIDETGNKYGLLTVLSLTKDKNGRTAWLCNCDCGNQKIARGPDLRAGKITSCGCMKGKHINNIRDITGQKFGFLTALKYEYSLNEKQYWSFQCDCGQICIKQKAAVINGNTTSCGCKWTELNSMHNRVLGNIGDIYGMQQIIENIMDPQQRGKTLVKCKCIKCGRENIYNLAQLKYHAHASCLCINSYPEYEIEQWLIKHQIQYKQQYTFEDLATDITNYKTRLRFDFAILNSQAEVVGLIEYNGEQHYRTWEFDKDITDFEKRKYRDNLKIEYCQLHNIPLLILTKDSDKNKQLNDFIKTFSD